jgi:hypothetical protein
MRLFPGGLAVDDPPSLRASAHLLSPSQLCGRSVFDCLHYARKGVLCQTGELLECIQSVISELPMLLRRMACLARDGPKGRTHSIRYDYHLTGHVSISRLTPVLEDKQGALETATSYSSEESCRLFDSR